MVKKVCNKFKAMFKHNVSKIIPATPATTTIGGRTQVYEKHLHYICSRPTLVATDIQRQRTDNTMRRHKPTPCVFEGPICRKCSST